MRRTSLSLSSLLPHTGWVHEAVNTQPLPKLEYRQAPCLYPPPMGLAESVGFFLTFPTPSYLWPYLEIGQPLRFVSPALLTACVSGPSPPMASAGIQTWAPSKALSGCKRCPTGAHCVFQGSPEACPCTAVTCHGPQRPCGMRLLPSGAVTGEQLPANSPTTWGLIGH